MKISYTAKIKLVKVVLLCIVALVFLSFLILPSIYIKIKTSSYLFAANMLSSLLKKDITPPVISGTTKQGGAYYLSAEKITNNIFNLNKQEGGVITATKPTLLYTTNKNELIFTVRSREANIDTESRIINMPGTVNITSNQSYSALLKGIIIDIKNNYAASSNPVTAKFEDKNLTAKGINVTKGGNIVILKGPLEIRTITKNKINNKK